MGSKGRDAERVRVPCLEQLEPRLLLSSDPVSLVGSPALVNQPLDTVIPVDLTPGQTTTLAEQAQDRDQATVMTVLVESANSSRDDMLGDTQDGVTRESSEVTYAARQTILETTTPAPASSFTRQEPEGETPGNPEDLLFSTTEQLVATLRVPNGPPEGSPQGIAQVVDGVLVFRASAAQNNLTLRLGGTGTPVLDLLTGIGERIGSWSAADIRTLQIIGTDEANDTLSIDVNPLQPVTCSIFYHGGAGGYDSLLVTSASRFSMDYEAVGADSGVIRLRDSATTISVSFAGLEPVDVQGGAGYTLRPRTGLITSPLTALLRGGVKSPAPAGVSASSQSRSGVFQPLLSMWAPMTRRVTTPTLSLLMVGGWLLQA